MALTHSFAGSAYPASPAEWKGDGYLRSPESDHISGNFRIVVERGSELLVGNGEGAAEKLWFIDIDEWAEKESGDG